MLRLARGRGLLRGGRLMAGQDCDGKQQRQPKQADQARFVVAAAGAQGLCSKRPERVDEGCHGGQACASAASGRDPLPFSKRLLAESEYRFQLTTGS